jgi:hypothetical protein
MSEWVAACFALAIGMLAGNIYGDSLTLRDCAVSGEARMMSGGTISCHVKQKEKP